MAKTTMTVKEAVEEYRYAILKHSEKTQGWYIQKLEVFAEWCELQQLCIEQVRATHIRKFIDEISKRINPRTGKQVSSYTTHGYAQVIKGFLNWCSKEDELEDLVSSKVAARVDMPKVDQTIIETFTPEMIRAMLSVCSKEYTDVLAARDRAIISVLVDTGIRASELCGLTLDNVHLEAFDAFIKVMGKGRKEREVSLGKTARTALHKYITRYRKADKQEQHVFLNRYNQPMSVNGLDQMLYRLEEWAHIKGVRVSAHTFRHTFAVNYLNNGGDVYKLSRLMGHTSVSITEVYLKAVKAKDARQGASVLDNLK